MTPSLTQHLLELKTSVGYSAAIDHPFLQNASLGTVNHDLLGLWLAQDRLYAAHAYPRFIGSLISLIPFHASHAIGSDEENHTNRILDVLTFALTNVIREVDFFKDTARVWNLKIEGWGERKGTRDYTAEMARITGGSGSGFVDGLVFLWAMEKVYLDAWTRVHDARIANNSLKPNETQSALLALSENWSCPEFVDFVDRIATVVDGLGIAPGSFEWRRAEDVFRRVVELEAAFWPEEGEEQQLIH